MNLISILAHKRAAPPAAIAPLASDPHTRVAWIADRDPRFNTIAAQITTLAPEELATKGWRDVWDREVDPRPASTDPIPPACVAAIDKAKNVAKVAAALDANPYLEFCRDAEDLRAGLILVAESLDAPADLLRRFSVSSVLRAVWFRRAMPEQTARSAAKVGELARLREGVAARGRTAVRRIEDRFGASLITKILDRPPSFATYGECDAWTRDAPRKIRERLFFEHKAKVTTKLEQLAARADLWIEQAARDPIEPGQNVRVRGLNGPVELLAQRRTWYGAARSVVKLPNGSPLDVPAGDIELELPEELAPLLDALRRTMPELVPPSAVRAIRVGAHVVMRRNDHEGTHTSGRIVREGRRTIVARLACGCEHELLRRNLISIRELLRTGEAHEILRGRTIALMEERLLETFLSHWDLSPDAFASIMTTTESPFAALGEAERIADARITALESELGDLGPQAEYMRRYLAAVS